LPKVVTTETWPAGTINKAWVSNNMPVNETIRARVAAPPPLPEPPGVTFRIGFVIKIPFVF
jgi:hypothetical protein